VCNSVRDLGVIVNDSFTPSNHIAKITAIAHQRVNILLQSFTSRDGAILVKAFITYVRPLLEYNTVVWTPYLKGYIHTMENVQRRFTKRLPGCSNLTYAERRTKLCLPTLELRRIHSDLIMCYISSCVLLCMCLAFWKKCDHGQSSRQSFNHLEHFDQVCTVSSFFK